MYMEEKQCHFIYIYKQTYNSNTTNNQFILHFYIFVFAGPHRCSTRKATDGTVVKVKEAKTYPHIPSLQSKILLMCMEDDQPLPRTVPLSAEDPRLIGPNIAPVPAQPTAVLLREHRSRFQHASTSRATDKWLWNDCDIFRICHHGVYLYSVFHVTDMNFVLCVVVVFIRGGVFYGKDYFHPPDNEMWLMFCFEMSSPWIKKTLTICVLAVLEI